MTLELDTTLNKTFKNLEERSTPKLIVRDEGEVWQVEMFHVINIGKRAPEANFMAYLKELIREFQYEITRTVYPSMPATNSHHVMLDEQDTLVDKLNSEKKNAR